MITYFRKIARHLAAVVPLVSMKHRMAFDVSAIDPLALGLARVTPCAMTEWFNAIMVAVEAEVMRVGERDGLSIDDRRGLRRYVIHRVAGLDIDDVLRASDPWFAGECGSLADALSGVVSIGNDPRWAGVERA